MSVKLLPTLLFFAACIHSEDEATMRSHDTAFAASVAIGRGLELDDLEIVPDAREIYPRQIVECGANYLREMPATDGIALFAFRIPSSDHENIMRCLRSELPGLIDIQRARL